MFRDQQLKAVLLGQLTHHCHILLMNGDSYRFQQSISARQASLRGIDPGPTAREHTEQTRAAKEVDGPEAAEPKKVACRPLLPRGRGDGHRCEPVPYRQLLPL